MLNFYLVVIENIYLLFVYTFFKGISVEHRNSVVQKWCAFPFIFLLVFFEIPMNGFF